MATTFGANFALRTKNETNDAQQIMTDMLYETTGPEQTMKQIESVDDYNRQYDDNRCQAHVDLKTTIGRNKYSHKILSIADSSINSVGSWTVPDREPGHFSISEQEIP